VDEEFVRVCACIPVATIVAVLIKSLLCTCVWTFWACAGLLRLARAPGPCLALCVPQTLSAAVTCANCCCSLLPPVQLTLWNCVFDSNVDGVRDCIAKGVAVNRFAKVHTSLRGHFRMLTCMPSDGPNCRIRIASCLSHAMHCWLTGAQDGTPPICVASQNDSVAIVSLLIDAGADVNLAILKVVQHSLQPTCSHRSDAYACARAGHDTTGPGSSGCGSRPYRLPCFTEDV
jgi:hypothetical protein